NISIDEIKNCNKMSDIATKTNRLIIRNSIGVDLEKYNNIRFKSFENEAGKAVLEDKLNTFNKDLDFVWSVLSKTYSPECILVLHYSKDDNGLEELLNYIKRFVNPDKDTIKEIQQIKNDREERTKKILESIENRKREITKIDTKPNEI